MSEARTAEMPSAAPTPTEATPPAPSQTSQTPTAPPSDGAPSSLLGEAPPPAEPGYDAGNLSLPDGFKAEGEGFDAFSALMKTSGASQKTAQELVDLYGKSITAALKSQMDDWHKQQGDWQREVQADPELGGSKLDVVRQTVSKVLDNPELSDPKFREALVFTGAGNHPAIIRTLYRWAKSLSEGGAVIGGAPDRGRDGSINGERPSAATSLYGPGGPHSGGPNLRG